MIEFKMKYKCCEHCSNNPENNPHATGICFCALPAMERGGTTSGHITTTDTTQKVPQSTSYSTSTKGETK